MSSALVTKELLFAHFAGQTTVLQRQMIENWVAETPEQEEFFYACLHEWEMSHLQFHADTEAAIAKFNAYILAPQHVNEEQKIDRKARLTGRNPRGWQSWLVAASVFFALLLGSWLFREPLSQKSYSTGNGETCAITLSDGSKVVLNANSQLQVPRFGFGKTSRQVHLKGEARFSIVHTADNKKFMVFADPALQVEVLGTEFDLTARHGSAQVVLQRGKVKVSYQGKPEQVATTLIMAPGDLVSVDRTEKKLQVKQVRHPENYSAWQDGHLIFDQTSLGEIKQMLEDNYALQVKLKGIDESNVTVSGSFKAGNADELLQALSEVLSINVLRQDNQVLLTGRK